MKRIGMFVGLGALVFGSALPALAQAPPATAVTAGNVNVNFGGQMRVFGFAFDNLTDFADTGKASKTQIGATCSGSCNKDSQDFVFQRFRLFTTMTSADKKAGAYWALEIGDLTWGQGGGASGGEANAIGSGVPSTSGGSRVGNSKGASLGADGVNVETKNIYLWFEVPGLPNAKLLAGIHDVNFLASPTGGFFEDDAAGLQFTWQADPVDLILEWARFADQSTSNSQHNDAYIARFGVNVTPDTRFTLEGMLENEQCLANQTVPTTATQSGTVSINGAAPVPFTTTTTGTALGSCIQASIGDTFWIGGTGATKIGDISLGGALVYGQRELSCPTCSKLKASEKGFGMEVWGTVPVGPLTVYPEGWYATGDKNRPVTPGGGQVSNAVLTKNSDRLPVPESGASWGNVAPFVAEWLFGLNTIGGPAIGSPNYLDRSGTWGIGGSAVYAVTPAFSVGGGVAFVGASETGARCPAGGTPTCPKGQGNEFGDNAFEPDLGFIYKFNANLTISGIGGYIIPDRGDNAWGLAVRSQFAF